MALIGDSLSRCQVGDGRCDVPAEVMDHAP
ncbi:MAG: hypothetical protein GDYSWBUE_000241 [Candidatus Fervidibacterota bacterium]